MVNIIAYRTVNQQNWDPESMKHASGYGVTVVTPTRDVSHRRPPAATLPWGYEIEIEIHFQYGEGLGALLPAPDGYPFPHPCAALHTCPEARDRLPHSRLGPATRHRRCSTNIAGRRSQRPQFSRPALRRQHRVDA